MQRLFVTVGLIALVAALIWAGKTYEWVFLLSFAAGMFLWEFGYWGITGQWFWFSILRDQPPIPPSAGRE